MTATRISRAWPARSSRAAAAWPVASRSPYWRAYQPSQSPERAARHHASFARYQSTVAARPSSNEVRRPPAERRQLRRRPSRSAGRGPGRSSTCGRATTACRAGRGAAHDLAVGPLGRARRRCRSRRSRRGAARSRSPPAWSDDVQPVAALQPVAVQRQRLVVDRVGDEQRDELLGVVVRPVRVRAAGDDRVDAVGRRRSSGRAARRPPWPPRTASAARAASSSRGVALVDRAVDLVGRDLEEARRRLGAPARGTASSRTWTPITPVRRNASGSRIERSTCDSAAKLTTASDVGDERPDDRPDRRCRRATKREPGGHARGRRGPARGSPRLPA